MRIDKIVLEEGKYTVKVGHVAENSFAVTADRYDTKRWRDLTGDGLFLAMFHRIQELEDVCKQVGDGLEGILHGKELLPTTKLPWKPYSELKEPVHGMWIIGKYHDDTIPYSSMVMHNGYWQDEPTNDCEEATCFINPDEYIILEMPDAQNA